jgi:hypothetical protein
LLAGPSSAGALEPTHAHSRLPDDLGKILNASITASEAATLVSSLSAAERYNLLVNHTKPSSDYVFPITCYKKFNREFKLHYLEDYPWLAYSQCLDGAFCLPCAVMCSSEIRSKLGKFVNAPFINWNKIHEAAKKHQQNSYHHEAIQAAKNLKLSISNPESGVDVLVDKEKEKNIEKNRKVLKSVAEAILFCARQCIALRGDHEDLVDESINSGNFLALLRLLAKHDPLLQEHLDLNLHKSNSQYISPTIQNELIEIMGNDIIRKDLIEEIKAADFYAVMADEVTSHNHEQLSLCVRFVDKDRNVREEFMDFISMESITGEKIALAILNALESYGLDAAKIRGQGYDGAANMSSNNVGVQKRIRDVSEKAVYVHCSGHSLNLVIAHSCAIPGVRNALDKMKSCCLFFQVSPKREGKLCLCKTHCCQILMINYHMAETS